MTITKALVTVKEPAPLQFRPSEALQWAKAHVSGFQRGLIVGFVFGCLSILAFLA